MNNQQQKKAVYWIIASIILILVFLLGQKSGHYNALKSINFRNSEEITKSFEPFWKVWDVLNEKFVDATTTNNQKRIWGAIQGLANSVDDPYTVFFPPEEDENFKNDIAGNFEGVGMEIGIKDGILTVVAPIKNSPAYKADVRVGDKIVKIDDKNTNDLSVDNAVKLIRGKKGTTVKITFVREGYNEPIEKTIQRDVIEMPTLETEIKDNVFIIKLYSFTAQSPRLFRDSMREFLESGSNKLIIDLRNNPGGYLDAAWDIASWFLPVGEVVVTEDFGDQSKKDKVYRSKGYDVLNKYFGNNYKVLVLVNGGSASASEILAGALREQGVAKLLGTKTFGKGSVQELVPITSETSLKVTIARWLTPEGHSPSNDGIVPDIEVKISQKDIENKIDAQLIKAVEILKK